VDPEADDYAAQIRADDADPFARLEEAHRLLSESDDTWLNERGGVIE
jgi:hypothetical protein